MTYAIAMSFELSEVSKTRGVSAKMMLRPRLGGSSLKCAGTAERVIIWS